MIRTLKEWAEQRGYHVTWCSLEAVERVRREIEERHAAHVWDQGFFEGEIAAILKGSEAASTRTVILVAVPRPAHRVGVAFEDGATETLLPPTYFRYRAVFEDVRMDLAANGLPGAVVEHLTAPLKALAARLGLVRYGRNNITYAPGTGSYLQLCGYMTGAILPDIEKWMSPDEMLLPECAGCGICVAMCPTEAIDAERMLLRAERCLTYANENPGPWPEWTGAGVHRCLLGCLECQRACPANPDLPVEETSLCFTAADIDCLLSEDVAGAAGTSPGIQSKLAWLGQPYAEPVLGRNLRALEDTWRLRGRPIPSTAHTAPD